MGGNNQNAGSGLIIMALVVGGILYLAMEHPLWLIPIGLIAILFFAWLFKK